MTLVHKLLLLRHLIILIVLHLLLWWETALHGLLHSHHLLLLVLILHLHLLVLVLIGQRLVEISMIEFVWLEIISHLYVQLIINKKKDLK
jgi:hypothetical protein